MDADDAAARLRAADPAAGLESTWAGPPQDEVLAHAGRRLWAPALAVAALVVAVAGVALIARPGTSKAPAPPAVSSPAPSAVPDTDATRRESTDALLVGLLAKVPVLPDAVQRSSAPAALLRTADQDAGYLLDRHRWWTAPGTMNSAIAYLSGHLPDGVEQTGYSAQKHDARNGHSAGTDLRGLNWAPLTLPTQVQDAQILLAVVPFHGGVAVRADAQGSWVPVRPDNTKIPRANELHVVLTRDTKVTTVNGLGAPTVRRTLHGADVAVVEHAVNRLSIPDPGTRMCAMDYGDFNDALTFHTDSGDWSVVVHLTGCTTVAITPPGGKTVRYLPNDINATLMHLLGLPANYGMH